MKKSYTISLAVGSVLIIAAIFGGIFWLIKADEQKPKQDQTDVLEKKQSSYITSFTSQEKEIYYSMFDKTKILDGKETTAEEMVAKIDVQFQEYKETFRDLINLEDTDERTLRALFIMNFVSFTNYYGTPDLQETADTIKSLVWDIKSANCQTNAMLLQMLLEKAGYESRTIAISGRSHGYNEVRINGKWNVLDATTNIWIDRSTQELIDGKVGAVNKFFVDENDLSNVEYSDDTSLTSLRIKMSYLGTDFRPEISAYNYVDLSTWKY